MPHQEVKRSPIEAPADISPSRYRGLLESWKFEITSQLALPGAGERATAICKASETEISSARCCGYHGCSFRALITAMQTGNLPSGLGPLGGRLYIAPSSDSFPNASREASIKDAKGYAELNTTRDLVAGLLGLPYGDPLASRICVSYSSGNKREFDEMLKATKLCLRELDTLIELAEGRTYARRGSLTFDTREQGVVIGLSTDVLTDFNIKPGDYEDKQIIAPQGIPVRYLTSIKPVGEFETDVLKALSAFKRPSS